MTWYLYKQPSGYPDLTDYELNLALFPGYELVGSYEEAPTVQGMKFDANNQLVEDRVEPLYVEQRKYSYPAIGDQMDMFWHAMNDGVIPKIEPFFSDIKAVKDRYPKP